MSPGYWSGIEEYEIERTYNIDEFVRNLARMVDDAFADIDDRYHPAYLGVDNAVKLYSLIRENKPSVVIETGVCNGMSSAVILKALVDNGKGYLHSVDLPVKAGSVPGRKGAVIPPGKTSGWAVPEEFKDRWELYLGNTFYELPKIFEEVGEIDMFIHDSGHAYEIMMFEFGIAWYHLREGGSLLADNTDKNQAFKDFASAKERTVYRMNKLAIMKR